MDNYKFVCKVSEIPIDGMINFKIGGRDILVINSEDKYYAIDGVCTHAQCSLEKGILEGKVLTCPCHGGQYNIESGEVISLPPITALKKYNLKIEGEDINISL